MTKHVSSNASSDFRSDAERRQMIAGTAARRAQRLERAAEQRERTRALVEQLEIGDRVRATFAHDPKPLVCEGRLHGSDLFGENVLRLVEHPSAPPVAVDGQPGPGLDQLERITPGRLVSVAYTVGLQVEVDLDAGTVTRVRLTDDITPDRDGYSEDLDTYQPLSPIDPARAAAYVVAESAMWPA
jgi:hypothetical protein